MAKVNKKIEDREFMEMAIDVMKNSIQEPREDKVSPKVGAVLVKSDGSIETAFRGELRHGDHAEFTLLERKNRSEKLDGATLYATLEPCAPGARKHPKLGCAERIVNARIKKVFIGVEDPDPKVDRKGIQYLIDNGIEVVMFDADLQKLINESNKQFIIEATQRAKQENEEIAQILLTQKENIEEDALLEDLSVIEIEKFLLKANIKSTFKSDKFYKIFRQLGFLETKNGVIHPTGIGLLLFGEYPQIPFTNALIRATYKTKDRGEEPKDFNGPITTQSLQAIDWFIDKLNYQITRNTAQRQTIYDYPIEIIREALSNAIVHRDYDIEGAPIYFEINDDAIIIKSPGEPVKPLIFEQIKRFNAPSLSRNPKIMYVFNQLELVEQRGFGFQSIKELPTKYSLPLPIVTYDAPYIVMTFPRSGEALKTVSSENNIHELSADELKVYNWIRTQNEVSTKDYAEAFGIAQRTASRHLSKLLELKLIETNGENLKSPKLKYKSKE
jgi:ATP-dependent DNA helicase RecG